MPDKDSVIVPLPIKLMTGAVAGAIGTSAIFPIDMARTRVQVNNGVRISPFDAIKSIIRNEGGFTALYKGLPTTLIGVCPEKAIKLGANEYFREMLTNDDGTIDFSNEMIAGAGAGFCQVVATNPMEVMKIRLQVQNSLPLAARQTASEILKELGFRGLYYGTSVTLLRDVPFSLLFFPAYANLKAFLADENGENSIASILVAGGVAGSIMAGLVTPADVVKTRLQVQGGRQKYGGIVNCARTIYREESTKAFFKGTGPRMIILASLFSITLLTFEVQKAYIIRHGLFSDSRKK